LCWDYLPGHSQPMARTAAMAVFAALAIGANGEGAKELTDANFDDEVVKSGKFAFVKFLAPW